jgi:DNA-binding NtrC family response regulator
MMIGRSESADVRLSDPTVSLCHAELRSDPRGIQVRDLESLNGTSVGEVIIRDALIPTGCVLTVGATVLRIEAAGEVVAPWSSATSFGALIGKAPAMRSLYAMLDRLVRTDLSVLIQGPTGTGKELAARSLHAQGARSGGPFVVLDCTALPPTLAASILFGHEKGSFTGADERHVGLCEAAHGGTLFIDEVGELPLELQTLLLRFLQERTVLPVGGVRPRQVDVRIISATWRDLRAMVNAGTFREDLYYRLAPTTVWMPPLDERREDIGLLIQHSLRNIPPDVRAARAITQEAVEALSARSFPGNVRELQSTIERLAILADGPMITTADLAFERMLEAARLRNYAPLSKPVSVEDPGSQAPALEPFKIAKRTVIDEFEHAYLMRLLERAGQNLTRAAAIAGLERHNLRELLKKHSLYVQTTKE